MSPRTTERAIDTEPGRAGLEELLLRLLRDSPRSRFGELLERTRREQELSRATFARHLAKLVRFGDIVLDSDHTYSVRVADGAPPRPAIEIRWDESILVIRPDGSPQAFVTREFRVISGSVEFLDLQFFESPRHFRWWLSAPARLSWTPAQEAPNRQPIARLDLAKPLTARHSEWQRLCVSVEMPPWYPMWRGPGARPLATGAGVRGGRCSEFVELLSHARKYEQRTGPDTILRLQVVLPDGFPLSAPRPRVGISPDRDRTDHQEVRRLKTLGARPDAQVGLRRSGSTMTLTVPRPLLDRAYGIDWGLPLKADFDGWREEPGPFSRR